MLKDVETVMKQVKMSTDTTHFALFGTQYKKTDCKDVVQCSDVEKWNIWPKVTQSATDSEKEISGIIKKEKSTFK